MKFRLRPHTGNHAETGPDGQPIIYKAGDTFHSHRDLKAAFPGKFDELPEDKTPIQKAAEEGAKDLKPEEPQKPTKPVAKPKPKGKAKKKAAPKGKGKTAVQKAAEQGAADLNPEEGEDDGNPLGRNVTKRFPKAIEEDFQVFSDGGAFSVVEADEITVALNDKPLKRKDVDAFILKYLET